MARVESESEHFHCRHSAEFTADAARVLALLERTRERLGEHFAQQPQLLTVVLHDSVASLALSNPLLALQWALTGRAARRYVTGWCGRRELHVLSPEALRRRSSAVTGSFEMLALAPASLLARRVIIGQLPQLSAARAPLRLFAELRCAWLLDGVSRWISGESAYSRGAIAARMRDGRRPRFPPGAGDAPLLAPALVELLVKARGSAAVADLVFGLREGGERTAITRAFAGRTLDAVESDWRSTLRRVAEGR